MGKSKTANDQDRKSCVLFVQKLSVIIEMSWWVCSIAGGLTNG